MERKYYKDRYVIQYTKPYQGFFHAHNGKYFSVLFYEEDGKFYELLTGKCLGTRSGDAQKEDVYIYSEEFGYSILLRGYYNDTDEAIQLTSEEFAAEAKICMNDKKLIMPHLNKRFDKWRTRQKNRLEKEQAKRAAEKQKQKENQQNVAWLNDLLNHRK